jgi:hypothetical protein
VLLEYRQHCDGLVGRLIVMVVMPDGVVLVGTEFSSESEEAIMGGIGGEATCPPRFEYKIKTAACEKLVKNS